MSFLERHAARLTTRDLRRTFAIGVGIALASALLTSVVMFGIASGATVTRRALAAVPVDAQVVMADGADPSAIAGIVNSDPAVAASMPFELVAFDTAELHRSGTAAQTSVGALVAVDDNYTKTTGLFAPVQGEHAGGQVMVSRDLATNLGAVPGDAITFTLPGGAQSQLVVSGIVDITGADLLLGPTDAAHRTAGANSPTNVAVVDRATLDGIAALVPHGAQPASPPALTTGPSSPVLVPASAVRRELHVRFDHSAAPGDPVAAQAWLDLIRRRIDVQGAGAFSVVDDASANLESVASDLLWGQVLFVFLALPGVLLALATSRFAADATAEATRRHIALLRARGATGREVARVLLVATAAVALIASLVGASIGATVAWLRFGNDLSVTDALGTTAGSIAFSVVVTTVLATIAAALPLRDQLRAELTFGRQELQRPKAPIWQRFDLDIAFIVAAVIVFVLTGGAGIHPVFNAEGNPTVTLALTSFLAPFLLWIGVTLLLLRIVTRLLRRSGHRIGSITSVLGPGGELAASSLQSRAAMASRTVVLLALTISFATSLLIFDATYRQQQRVDAQLTLGADLKVTPVTLATTSAIDEVKGVGVAAATPFVDRIVYVGSEAQDLLAIDPNTLPQVSPLADTFFDGSTADQAMRALQSQQDAILVSSETAHDYSLVPGDKLMIRVPDAYGNLRTVTFHMAGVALEFPTAPKDAFLVANQAFVAAQTGNDNISYVLARAPGDVTAIALQVQSRLGSNWIVNDLDTTTARLVNAITSVDLEQLVTIEVIFAVLIGAIGCALFLLAELASRRRELATMEAIGAEPRQLRIAIGGEVLVLGVAGVAIGTLVGALVGATLLQILAGLFDPPAQAPALPVLGLLVFIGAVAFGLIAAVAVASVALGRLGVLSALRER